MSSLPRNHILQSGGTCYAYAGLICIIMSTFGSKIAYRFMKEYNGSGNNSRKKMYDLLSDYFCARKDKSLLSNKRGETMLLESIRNSKKPSGLLRLHSYLPPFCSREIQGNSGGYPHRAFIRILLALGYKKMKPGENYQSHTYSEIEGLFSPSVIPRSEVIVSSFASGMTLKSMFSQFRPRVFTIPGHTLMGCIIFVRKANSSALSPATHVMSGFIRGNVKFVVDSAKTHPPVKCDFTKAHEINKALNRIYKGNLPRVFGGYAAIIHVKENSTLQVSLPCATRTSVNVNNAARGVKRKNAINNGVVGMLNNGI